MNAYALQWNTREHLNQGRRKKWEMRKSVTRTVRLDDDLDRAIQDQASETRVSVNFLVNRLIRKYVEWDIPAEKFGLGPVASVLLNRLFEDIDEESAGELGRWTAHEFTAPFCRYLFGELSFDTIVHTFRRASVYGSRYAFDTTSDSRNRIIVLRHNGGRKVSLFYAGIFKGLFTEALKMEVSVESTHDYCIAQVRIA